MADPDRTKTGSSMDLKNLQRRMSVYSHPTKWRSIWQLTNSLIPYVALWVLSYYALQYSFWLALPPILLASGFLVRIFIIFHDCGHYSFFNSARADHIWGIITGIITFTPFYGWHAAHYRHHKTSGNLQQRGQGDVWTMTLGEFKAASFKTRLKYRLYRHPAIMFLLGPILIFSVSNRVPKKKVDRKEQHSVLLTDAAIIVVAIGMSFLIGWKSYLIIQILIVYFGLVAGVWLFYVQHQFEDVYWAEDDDWSFVEASLHGASFYKLPAVLRWFTGNIGYHHVHHLHPGIPNYNLPKCHNNLAFLQKTKPIKLFASLKSLKFRLLDEQTNRMVGFKAAKN